MARGPTRREPMPGEKVGAQAVKLREGEMKQHKVCGGATPPCCYNVYSTSVEGTTSTCCARYRSRGECRLIGQQEFNPELLGRKIYSKILDKNNKFYYR